MDIIKCEELWINLIPAGYLQQTYVAEYTVLPARSDSDHVFFNKVIRDLEWIDHLCINPILRIGLIPKWSIN